MWKNKSRKPKLEFHVASCPNFTLTLSRPIHFSPKHCPDLSLPILVPWLALLSMLTIVALPRDCDCRPLTLPLSSIDIVVAVPISVSISVQVSIFVGVKWSDALNVLRLSSVNTAIVVHQHCSCRPDFSVSILV